MNMNPFDAVKVVNLTDFYLTREENRKQTRRMMRRFSHLNLAIGILGAGMAMLSFMIYEDRARLDQMERAKKKDETAG